MDAESGEIRFFHASSRIGRLRYFVYPLGLLLLSLPVLCVAGILSVLDHVLLAALILLLAYVFMLTMQFVFMVRRLHDMDRSGYWSLIYAGLIVLQYVLAFKNPGQPFTPGYLAIGIVMLGFVLMLLFTRGTPDENRFGPPPPPNSTWIVVGAWSYLVVGLLGGMLAAIAIPVYQDFIARSQMAEAIGLADNASSAAVAYYRQHDAWPTNLTAYRESGEDEPAGRYTNTVSVGMRDGRFTVTAEMKSLGVNRHVAGKSIEVWYDNEDRHWHCGPGGPDPVSPRYVPANCRDPGAP